MNVYLKMNDIKLNGSEKNIDLYDNIRYLYPKKNTIMDGEFTKILYSLILPGKSTLENLKSTTSNPK